MTTQLKEVTQADDVKMFLFFSPSSFLLFFFFLSRSFTCDATVVTSWVGLRHHRSEEGGGVVQGEGAVIFSHSPSGVFPLPSQTVVLWVRESLTLMKADWHHEKLMLHIRQSAPAAQGGGNLIFSFGEVDGRLTGHGFVCKRVMVRTASVIHKGAAVCGELRARASKSVVAKTNCFPHFLFAATLHCCTTAHYTNILHMLIQTGQKTQRKLSLTTMPELPPGLCRLISAQTSPPSD